MIWTSLILRTQYRRQICYVGCWMIANSWTYISLYIKNTAILEDKKIYLYFSASTCEHLWLSPSHLVNCAKCLHDPSKDATDWSVWKDFLKFIKFQSQFKTKMTATWCVDECRHLYSSLRKFRAQTLQLAKPYNVVSRKLPNR